MVSEQEKPRKDKSKKKEYKESEEVVSVCESFVEPVKSKKHKKRHVEEPVELQESFSQDSVKEKKNKKKHREIEDEPELEYVSEVKEKNKKKKEKKSREVEAEDEVVEVSEVKKKSKTVIEEEAISCSELNEEIKYFPRDQSDVVVATPQNTSGAQYWKRFDESKYIQSVQGTKFADNSHYSKGGDSWGDEAATRLGKVKGRGFKKEMSKLKRASWKGAGSIDTGINSVQFSDWED